MTKLHRTGKLQHSIKRHKVNQRITDEMAGAEDAIRHHIRKQVQANMNALENEIIYGNSAGPDFVPLGKSPLQSAKDEAFGNDQEMLRQDMEWVTLRDRRLEPQVVRYNLDDLSQADLDEIDRMLTIGKVLKVEREISGTGARTSTFTVTYRAGVEAINPSEISGECRQKSGNPFKHGGAVPPPNHWNDNIFSGVNKNGMRYTDAARESFGDPVGEVKFEHGFTSGGFVPPKQREQQHVFQTDFISGNQMKDYYKHGLKAEIKFDHDRSKPEQFEGSKKHQVEAILSKQRYSRGVPAHELMLINGITYHVQNAQWSQA